MNIKHEQIKAILVIFSFILTTIFLYLIGPSLFIMYTSIQIASFSFAGLLEYIFLWHVTEEERSKFKRSPSYFFLFILSLFPLTTEILEIIIGIEDISTLLQPTIWIVLWSFIVAWLLGIFVVRLFFIEKKKEKDSRDLREDKNTESLA